MSWQTYVDDHLMCEIEGNHLSSAAIIGHDGSTWALSATFPQLDALANGVVSKFSKDVAIALDVVRSHRNRPAASSSNVSVVSDTGESSDFGVLSSRSQAEGPDLFKPEEITAIMNDFSDPGSLAPTGLYLGGTKYMVIQGEAGAVIRGKKGPGGVTVKKTNMALIIGVYDEPMTPGQCNMIVERLGDYLLDQGF
ncbi:hypothetical protein RJ639_026629 [Escallonia herrerae]|uniref:Profilin n=1 Tax=Escallonia herrerae TaxID=1293975 RepID=A0AA88UV26_9ASTE|nr:hypothetical protein RJ639_026629 [Escallonia herrerae]